MERRSGEARRDLAGALKRWVILGLRQGEKLPVIDGIDLTPPLLAHIRREVGVSRNEWGAL